MKHEVVKFPAWTGRVAPHPVELLPVPTHDLAAEIWAETVRETGIWQLPSPFGEQLAEFGRVIIPKYRAAMKASS